MPHDFIQTERLLLWSMTPAFLSASLGGQRPDDIDFTIADDWFTERAIMEMRLQDLCDNPEAQPWLLRGIVERSTRQMVGHIGFHTPPDPPYLRSVCPGAVEFGYMVYPAYRRRGFALEAATGLMQWANTQHGVTNFIASADPYNAASVNLLARLGFTRVGGHVDAVDGYEDIFLRKEV